MISKNVFKAKPSALLVVLVNSNAIYSSRNVVVEEKKKNKQEQLLLLVRLARRHGHLCPSGRVSSVTLLF